MIQAISNVGLFGVPEKTQTKQNQKPVEQFCKEAIIDRKELQNRSILKIITPLLIFPYIQCQAK